MDLINRFENYFAFLRNFHECTVTYEDLEYPSSENAYQAAKICVPGDLTSTNILRVNAGFTLVSPAEAKKRGRIVKLRVDWDAVKDKVMYEILCAKFSQNPELAEELRLTYPAVLVEGNYWHDNYWGKCNCAKCSFKEGKNKLGIKLMRVRNEYL